MERKEAIEIFKNMLDAWDNYYTIAQSDKKREAVWLAISSLETDEAYQLEYEKPTTKNDLGVDCISRAEVLKLMKDNWHTHDGDWAMQESMDDIRALPSVYPKSDKPCDNCALNDGECIKKDICPKGVCAYTPSYPKSDKSVLEDIMTDLGRCKTENEMRIAERDYKTRLLISGIFSEVRAIVCRHMVEEQTHDKPTIPSDKEISDSLIGFCKKIVEEQTGENT